MVPCQEWAAVGWSLWEELIPLSARLDGGTVSRTHTPMEHPEIAVGPSAPRSAPTVQLCVTNHGGAAELECVTAT